ncbi:MAG: hypothetical protein WBA46_11245 [Thermomicrobiales bacterium]
MTIADRSRTVTTDLTVYGTYAPHFRYRQDRIAEALRIAALARNDDSPQDPGSSSPFASMRERIGIALITWGTRLEGTRPATSPKPAAQH